MNVAFLNLVELRELIIITGQTIRSTKLVRRESYTCLIIGTFRNFFLNYFVAISNNNNNIFYKSSIS